MILPGHNAHLTQVNGAPTIADPVLGQTGGPGPLKWEGDCQALIRDDVAEVMRGGERNQTQVLVRIAIVDVPSNLPATIDDNDSLTLQINTGETVQLQVRMKNLGFWSLGYYRYTCRYP